ncbi:Methyltransferase domain-containing protein [Enhydrobacter aerosaccus]|uniref:Methyltransferase domain-containing protein n=1 Tax=Enhydrobacter aerosaccus TaxID=225324 RepID=A0A1T4NJG0_9HYPH|nr:methyltransferase domain-containing protein [Enhydrobacter aerosaccus]SJZ79392.1 Methyltransferase domain-containing protein [Enhydrobacter aerosaccus]
MAALDAAMKWHPAEREMRRHLRALMAKVDSGRLEELRRQFGERMRKASADSRYKYLDVAFYTREKLRLARRLGLDKAPPLRVLDIGTGGGHFPFVCRYFGHSVVGIDIENPVYAGIAGSLGVERTIVRVEPGTPLPALDGRFDLITACNITFNEKRGDRGQPRQFWSLPEWQFFLEDLVANQLRYPGTIYLMLNKQSRRRLLGFEWPAYNRELMAMAARNGARIDRLGGTIRMSFASYRAIR